MLNFLINCLLYFLNFIGAVLMYAALFLYENEEDKFQNKIEEWWIRLSEKQIASRSKVAAFMQEVARLTGRGFDQLFGRRLFGIRVIPVSIYLSLASVFLVVLLTVPSSKYTPGATRQGAIGFVLFFLFLALVPAIYESK